MPSTEPKPMNTRPPVLTSSSSPAPSSSSYSSLILGILNASITSFEKLSDQKTWYNVKVVTTEHASFHIFRKFEDFVQFSQHLQDAYFSTQHHYHHQHQKSSSTSNSNTTRKNHQHHHHHHRHHHHRSEALPKIKTRINILPTTKHIHAQRAEELDHFLKCLVKQPSHIIDSMLVLEFFGLNKEVVSRSRSIKYDKLKPDEEDHDTPASSRWKRLRCTSFLARSPPSATNLSSLCSQAANRIIPWNRNNNSTASPQPSLSTPIISKPAASTSTVPMRKQTLKKSKSNLSVLSEVMVASPQPPPPPPLAPAPLEPVPIPQHPLDASTSNEHIPASMISLSSSITTCHSEQLLPSPNNSRMIKIKVIYDSDNIIVIQVPRTIEFSELRTRIAQKFSDPNMFKEVELLFLDTASSISSTATLTSDIPTVLINNQQDLSSIMHSKWNKLEKVTLRCSL